jgi:hypothetical protein
MFVQLHVINRSPKGPAAFDRAYREEHLPAGDKLRKLKECFLNVVSRLISQNGDPTEEVVWMAWDA